MIRLTEVKIDQRARDLVSQVLDSGQLAQGPMVAAFERQFAEMSRAPDAVATSSGTTALVLALEALELRPGDEVIMPGFTFIATLNAILEAGATARIVDINLQDFTLDAAAVGAVLSERTRAIIPVHLYGCPADMKSIHSVASGLNVTIIEDAAQAHGAEVAGQAVGSSGIACFSFYATKNMTTGEGGMVTTDQERIADRIRVLRNQGMRARYQYEVPGHNCRMTDLQAAIGLAQLECLDGWTRQRQANAARLTSMLTEVPSITTPLLPADRSHVFHQYTVLVDEDGPLPREQLAAALTERGIETGVYYPRTVDNYPCYANHPRVRREDLSRATEASRRVLSLPVHPGLSPQDLDRIAFEMADLLTR